MDVKELYIIGLVVVLPAIGLLIGFWYIRTSAARGPRKIYEVTLWGLRATLTTTSAWQIVWLLLLLWWLDMFLPFSFAFLLLIPAVLSLAKTRNLDPAMHDQETRQLLDRLGTMQKEIDGVRQHIENLSHTVLAKQAELDDKERIGKNLETLIAKKSEEAKVWQEMSQPQRDAFIEAAATAMSKESRGTFWWGLLLGFIINILATLTWTLMGNPGQDDILNKFNNTLKGFQIKSDAKQSITPSASQVPRR